LSTLPIFFTSPRHVHLFELRTYHSPARAFILSTSPSLFDPRRSLVLTARTPEVSEATCPRSPPHCWTMIAASMPDLVRMEDSPNLIDSVTFTLPSSTERSTFRATNACAVVVSARESPPPPPPPPNRETPETSPFFPRPEAFRLRHVHGYPRSPRSQSSKHGSLRPVITYFSLISPPALQIPSLFIIAFVSFNF